MEHPSLFDDEPGAPAGTNLIRHSRRKVPLSKREQAFGRLVAKVQSLRTRLDEEKGRLDQALVFHATHVRPRVHRAVTLRKDLVRALRPFLTDPRLKEGDRRMLASILAAQVDDILAHDEAPEQDIRDLFEQLNGVGFAQVAQEQLDQIRSEMRDAFDEIGLDIEVPEFRHGMSEEEAARAAAQLADRMQRAQDAQPGTHTNRPRTKRELREEKQRRLLEQHRHASIGAIYKRLVKALHPDLEQDTDLRDRKSAMMQEVTAAYARHDLHTLIRLELEWLDGGGAAARRTDETLDAYTAVLKQQVGEIETEIFDLRFHPRYHELLVEDGPFGLPVLIDPKAEVFRLDRVIEGIETALAHMAAGKALQEVRALIREQRRANRAQIPY